MNELYATIAARLAEAGGRDFDLGSVEPVGGGCINDAVVLRDTAGARYFVKLHDASRLDMFEAEREGLEALAATDTVRVPRPLLHGTCHARAFLALEYLPLTRASGAAMVDLGRLLARMHAATADAFGWHRDNTIGETLQPNGRSADWSTFWVERRLGPQIELARSHGASKALLRTGESLLAEVPALLAGHRPRPSLLHGDLWGGNCAADSDGRPVLFDPAVYYGDREADLAMTELFGGFTRGFRDAYESAWPLEPGYPRRRELYNVYHVLNHFNLFGGGYAAQAQSMMERLLGELR